SVASGTSKKMELKLTNVAKASLAELRLDYEDFLRQRGLALWPRDDPRRQALIDRRPGTAEEVAAWARAVHEGEFCGPGGQGGQSGHSGAGGANEASAAGGASGPGPTPSTPSTPSTKSTK